MYQKLIKLSILSLLLTTFACSPKVRTRVIDKYPSLTQDKQVFVYQLKETPPKEAKKIGVLKVGEGGLTVNCGFDRVLEIAKKKAQEMGGNVIKITQHRTPDFLSSCHRIEADVLRIEQLLNQTVAIKHHSSDTTKNQFIKKKEPRQRTLPKFAYGVGIGYNYTLGSVDENIDNSLKEYFNKLRNGYNLRSHFSYFWNDNWGFGVDYNWFRNRNSTSPVRVSSNIFGFSGVGKLENKISLHSLTPTFSYRYSSRKNPSDIIYLGLGLGYSWYRDDATLVNPIFITGNTFHSKLSLGYVGANIDFSISLLSGALSALNYDTGSKVMNIDLGENRESISRIMLNLGLTFN